jgi:3-hydroxyisobutyrate dehydrogenase
VAGSAGPDAWDRRPGPPDGRRPLDTGRRLQQNRRKRLQTVPGELARSPAGRWTTLQGAAVLRAGWIGTGRMGAAMAERLLRAGVELAVWNRTAAKAEPLTRLGAELAGDPAELAGRDVVFTSVSASADLLDVTERLLSHSTGSPGCLVDTSTVSAEASAGARERAAAAGWEFLAAPVSGNGKVVRAGLLTLVVSGPRDAFDRVQPLLQMLGRHVSYVGDGELSRTAKICHNLMLGVVAQNLAEITVLAEKAGMTRAAFLDFMNNSVMGSMFTRYKSPAYVHLDFTPTFTPVLLQKDFDLGLSAARELNVPMPVVAAARETVAAAVAQGRVAEDFAVLLELQARASGLQIAPEDADVDDGLGGRPPL